MARPRFYPGELCHIINLLKLEEERLVRERVQLESWKRDAENLVQQSQEKFWHVNSISVGTLVRLKEAYALQEHLKGTAFKESRDRLLFNHYLIVKCQNLLEHKRGIVPVREALRIAFSVQVPVSRSLAVVSPPFSELVRGS